ALVGAPDAPGRSAAAAPPSAPKPIATRTIAPTREAKMVTRTDMGGPCEPVLLHYGGAVNPNLPSPVSAAGHPPPAPFPSPTARPNKGVLTICSSGCAAFGHPASPPKDRSPTRDGRECRGQIWFAASQRCGAHGPSKPMFLWTPPVLWAAHAARNGGAALKF